MAEVQDVQNSSAVQEDGPCLDKDDNVHICMKETPSTCYKLPSLSYHLFFYEAAEHGCISLYMPVWYMECMPLVSETASKTGMIMLFVVSETASKTALIMLFVVSDTASKTALIMLFIVCCFRYCIKDGPDHVVYCLLFQRLHQRRP